MAKITSAGDSWEKLERDAHERSGIYCHFYGLDADESPYPCDWTTMPEHIKALDLVRRAKRLAEAEGSTAPICAARESWTWEEHNQFPALQCSRCGERMPKETVALFETGGIYVIPKYPCCPYCGAKVVDAGLGYDGGGSYGDVDMFDCDHEVEGFANLEGLMRAISLGESGKAGIMSVSSPGASASPEERLCEGLHFYRGLVCGLVMAAAMAVRFLPEAEGDPFAAHLLAHAGVETLDDIRAGRGNPFDEYDVDYLACHFGKLDESEFAELIWKEGRR